MVPTQVAHLTIVRYPDPVLRTPCEPVSSFGPDLAALADRMIELMREVNGVGLAAPQLGVPIRMFVSNVTGEPGNDIVCVNPQFSELTGGVENEEGCLSLPGVTVTLRRATRAVICARTPTGESFQKTGEDLAARVWQHESDHLDGRLIIDNMSATDEIANRRALKQLETDRQAGSASQQAGSAGFTASQRPKGFPRCESPS